MANALAYRRRSDWWRVTPEGLANGEPKQMASADQRRALTYKPC